MSMMRYVARCAIVVLIGSCQAGVGMQGSASGSGSASAQGSGGGELGARCQGDFGVSASAQKLEAFMSATAAFTTTAAELEGELLAACRDMGTELGVPEAEMQPAGNQPAVQVACNAAAARLQAELADLKAQASLEVHVVAVPPRCEVDMDAYASCAAECDAKVEPGKVELECEGGEIVGKCNAECKGSCSVEVAGKCGGECHGTCSGGCKGKCEGACDGKCSAKNAKGECAGKCDGTCNGTCSAKCQGECNGECWVKGQASCEGECHGGCSVAYEAPRCTGEVKPPQIDAECKASCDAKLNAKAKCEPGRAEIAISGKAKTNVDEKLAKIRAAVQGGVGAILAVNAKLARLGASGSAMIQTAGQLPQVIGDLGVGAAACVTQAAAALPRATASVSVSVQASASISGAVGSG